MWCDILTKPKQGKVFREFRRYLMNVPADYDDEAERLLTHSYILPRVEAEPTLSQMIRVPPQVAKKKDEGKCIFRERYLVRKQVYPKIYTVY